MSKITWILLLIVDTFILWVGFYPPAIAFPPGVTGIILLSILIGTFKNTWLKK